MIKPIVTLMFSFLIFSIHAQSPIGLWKNFDDDDGKEKSHIEIYEKNGKLFGKVIKLLPSATIKTCVKCKGSKKGKDLIGLDIMWDLTKSGKGYDNGTVVDPKTGKEYDCKIELDGNDKLKVRGYIGVSMFGRTQVWKRVVL